MAMIGNYRKNSIQPLNDNSTYLCGVSTIALFLGMKKPPLGRSFRPKPESTKWRGKG